MPSKNPTNMRHGGIGLFFNNSLPIEIRYDLAFEESIVVELNFGRIKNLLYRSLTINHTSPEFLALNKNPYASVFTEDLNGHSQFCWPDGDKTAEGREIENLPSSLSLSQLISEPTILN